MLLVIGLYFKGSNVFGASGTRFPNGLSADSTSPVAGQVRGTTLTVTGDTTLGGGSGALVITTTDAATSTVQVGCIQTTATSTASPIKLLVNQSATTTTLNSATVRGVVLWAFGTCP